MTKVRERQIPREVARRIVERCARSEAIVVTSRRGKPSRVYDLQKYLKMREQPGKTKPWTYRKSRLAASEPLGAVDGRPLIPLRRENIYD